MTASMSSAGGAVPGRRHHRVTSGAPKSAQPVVPWARVASSLARLTWRCLRLMGEDRGQVALAEPARGCGLTQRPVNYSCRVSRASCTAPANLARTRPAPAAAASASHSPAPSPIARNSASAAVRAFGLRPSAPGGGGG